MAFVKVPYTLLVGFGLIKVWRWSLKPESFSLMVTMYFYVMVEALSIVRCITPVLGLLDDLRWPNAFGVHPTPWVGKLGEYSLS